MTTVLDKRKLYDRVVETVGTRIVRGELRAGDALPNETDLSVQMGVSRTVIREAIKILAEKGLVATRPRAGTVVQSEDNWNLLDADVLHWNYQNGPNQRFLDDLMELRLILEPAVARQAAVRATDEDIERITTFYQEMEAGVADMDAYIPADIRFHTAVCRATHNRMLEQLTNTIVIGLLAGRTVTARVPHAAGEALPLHRAVMEAIRRRDPTAADAAMRALLHMVSDHITQGMALPQTT